MPIDYQAARQLLDTEFAAVENASLAGHPAVPSNEQIVEQFNPVFASATQAYREVLLGCIVAKIQDPALDVHKPYMSHGPDAYNARTLDSEVVNPFLRDRRIPSSAGAFLSTFRRSVMFIPATRNGLRDKTGYDVLLQIIDQVNDSSPQQLAAILQYTLYRFIQLRDAAVVPLARLQRISLEQYDLLVEGLLSTASGGRFPVVIVEAAFAAIRDTFGLDWTIEVQGINVADGPAGTGGDITIRSGGELLLAAEVTERPLDRNRVITTFQTKIAPHAIEDYLFFITIPVGSAVKRQSRQYFAQGHEVDFLQIRDWAHSILAAIGRRGRAAFSRVILERLEEMPAAMKVAWNEQIARITEA